MRSDDPSRFEPHFPPVHSGPDAEARLARLGGLTVPMIHRAAVIGDQARREVTAIHPSNYAGHRMQAEMFAGLGEQLVTDGWMKARRRDDVLERLHAPSRGFALTVNSGTSDVGDVDGTPSTRNPRGGAGKAAIDANQGLLFDLSAVEPRMDDVLTWFVLFYVDKVDEGRIRLEVSLPELREGGHVIRWRERIIVPTLEPPAGRTASDGRPTTEVPSVDVRVRRRSK